MEIWKVKAALTSRKIRYYNSFTGAFVGFKVGEVTEVVNALCCKPIEGTSRVFISKDNVEELLASKYICRKFEVDGAPYKEEWNIEK